LASPWPLTLRVSLPVTPPPPSSVVPPLRPVWMGKLSNLTVSKPLEPHHTLPLRYGCHTAPGPPKVPRSSAPTRPVNTLERSYVMVDKPSPTASSNDARCQIPSI